MNNTSDIQPENLVCTEVDYNNPIHLEHLVLLLNAYSLDSMGNSKPLPEDTLLRLSADLPKIKGALSFIAYLKTEDTSIPVGLINCFMGYSTFKAKPLLNIHDVVVLDGYRGNGIGASLIKAVSEKARHLGCCKLTLEVRTDNPAEKLYRHLGFADGNQPMIFLTKDL